MTRLDGTPAPRGAPDGNFWHAEPAELALERLDSDPRSGLSSAEAARRLERWGPNALPAPEAPRWYALFARQFADVLIAILAVAAVVSVAIGERVDAVVILAILVFNGLLGFAQEWRAERAISALRRMLAPRCTVLRDGRRQSIDAEALVAGDLVALETGARVPADLRLVETLDLRLDESSLTGESDSVPKGTEPVAPDTPLAERSCIAWMGTAVTHGRALGVAVATGLDTEFGRIAQLTRAVETERTPLQRRLAALGSQLGLLAVSVSVLVAVAGWWLGKPALDMFMLGVSLAVAVVPEGLPAVVTITLAVGVRSMVRRKALLRRLPAAETLGSATVICTDKTGTLTRNEMTVRRVWLASGELTASGVGYDPTGDFTANGQPVDPLERGDLRALLSTGLLCNHAQLSQVEGRWHAVGEPTELALVVAALKASLAPADESTVLAEFPFSSARKRMTQVRRGASGRVAHVKGAPEVILERCTHLLDGAEVRELHSADRAAAVEAYQDFARLGLRTLALARAELPLDLPLEEAAVEADLVLLGIVGILDPPRNEVPRAIALAQSAGIRVLMITGDAAPTALAIARQVGLEAARAVSGAEIDAMDDAALRAALQQRALFARTTPEHKLRIVTLLQEMGHVAAMTGDGVNDAPALKKADIGIAMGVKGTDVAKGASDMVLTDDNFASIIAAVEEGRRQYDNIVKFVGNLLSSNLGEVFAIAGSILIGGPLIFLPVQILWINLVTDGLTSIALGVEPAEKGVMQRPPRPLAEPVLTRDRNLTLMLMGVYVGVATLWIFHSYLGSDDPARAASAQTVAFTALILLEVVNALNFRSLAAPLHELGFLTNPWLLAAMGGSVALQVGAVYTPLGQTALHMVPLAWADWAWMLALAAPLFVVNEAVKRARWRPGAAV